MTRLRGERLEARARIVRAVRAFFWARGYVEVETPHRVPTVIPESHIDPVPSDGWFLHTSPEACMKRLMAAGLGRIFQICRCWRAGERGRLHLPEFTLLEWYRQGADYRDLMGECEELFLAVANALGKGTELTYRGRRVDLTPPWPRIPLDRAFREHAGVGPETALSRGTFDELLVTRVEPALASMEKPVFLYDYPLEQGALARRRPDRPDRVERFELYAGGLELANAFSELNDPAEQEERFRKERETRARAGRLVTPLPGRFLRDLDRLPECAGIALGIDRLVMLFTGAGSIDEVVAFTPEEL